MDKSGYGLGRLAPPFALIITIICVLRLSFADFVEVAFLHLPFSFLLLLLNFRLRFKPLFFISIATTFVYLFIGNVLFRDSEFGNISTSALSADHVRAGVEAALPRTVMLFYGFAWINSGDVQKFTQTFLLFGRYLPIESSYKIIVHVTATFFIALESSNRTLEEAIKFHTSSMKTKPSFADRIRLTWYRLNSLIFKLFSSIPDLAFIMESRRKNWPRIKREVNAFRVNVSYSKYGEQDFKLAISRKWTCNKIDMSDLSRPVQVATINIMTGFVPNIQGKVEGRFDLFKGIDLLKMEDKAVYSLVRYVGADSNFRQLLGPTVFLEMLSSCKDNKICIAALHEFGLSKYQAVGINNLSGGQKVRLALASAKVSNSKVVILDGVESQLDVDGREILRKWIENESKMEGKYFVSFGEGVRVEDKIFEARKVERSVNKAEMGVAISVRELTLRRGGTLLLRDWSYNFQYGRIYILTGPNGVGKTSLGLCIGGCLDPEGGEIVANAAIGMSFQNPLEQIIRFRVEEEIVIRPSLNRISNEEKLQFTDQCFEFWDIGIDEVLSLSYFDIRKLSIATMSFRSRILILDEPSNFLTSKSQVEALNHRLGKLRDAGVCVILISHDPSYWNYDKIVELSKI